MSLLAGMVDHWPLNEQSGVRYSATGLNNLTDNATVTGNPGKVGMASQFTRANAEYFSLADNQYVSITDQDFSFIVWFLNDTTGNNQILFTKTLDASVSEYGMSRRTAGNMRFGINSGAGGVSIGEINYTAITPAASTWYMAYGAHDSVNNIVIFQLNDAAQETVATTGVPQDTTSPFYIGWTPLTVNYWDGRINALTMYKRLLTNAEIAQHYNNGRGLAYPFDNHATGHIRRNRLVGQLTNI